MAVVSQLVLQALVLDLELDGLGQHVQHVVLLNILYDTLTMIHVYIYIYIYTCIYIYIYREREIHM